MPTITMFYSKVGGFSPAFCLLNPLSTDGDQHQCSPCIFNALSKREVTFIQELRTWSHKIDFIDTKGSD